MSYTRAMLSLSRVLAVTVTALALRAPRPPLRVRSGTVRNGVSAAAAEAAAQISSGLEAFEAAKSSTDVGLALTKIYSALPLDDESLDAFGPDSLESGFLSAQSKLETFREIAARRGEDGLWSDDNVASYKALRGELDPLHATDLRGYLSFAGALGGVLLYGAGLAIQQKLPEIFPAVYVFLATCFAAPFVYAFFLA